MNNSAFEKMKVAIPILSGIATIIILFVGDGLLTRSKPDNPNRFKTIEDTQRPTSFSKRKEIVAPATPNFFKEKIIGRWIVQSKNEGDPKNLIFMFNRDGTFKTGDPMSGIVDGEYNFVDSRNVKINFRSIWTNLVIRTITRQISPQLAFKIISITENSMKILSISGKEVALNREH